MIIYLGSLTKSQKVRNRIGLVFLRAAGDKFLCWYLLDFLIASDRRFCNFIMSNDLLGEILPTMCVIN